MIHFTEVSATLRLAWPMILSQLAYKSQLIGNVVLMGWIGPRDLAVGAMAVSIINPVLFFAGGILSASTPLVAQSLGAGASDGGRKYLRQSLWMALLIAIAVLPLFANIAPLLRAFGQSPDLAEQAADFARILGFMGFPSIGIIVFRNFFAAHGIPHVPVTIIVLGSLTNFLVGWGLISAGFSLHGLAVSTVAVNFLMLAAMVGYIQVDRRLRQFGYFRRIHVFDFRVSARILALGLPIGITVLSEIALFSAISLMMGRIGAAELAAYTAAAQFVGIAFSVTTGIGIAAMVRVGWARGRNDVAAVSRAGWSAIAITAAAMAISSSLFLLFPHSLIRVFIDPGQPGNAEAFNMAVAFMTFVAMLQIFDGIQGVSAHVLRGISDAIFPMLTAMAGYWLVGFLIARHLGFSAGLGATGIYAGLICGIAFVAIGMLLRFALLSRRMARTITDTGVSRHTGVATAQDNRDRVTK